ncbi:MAG: SRPBCC family protein [Nocardioidaceae bacterium]
MPEIVGDIVVDRPVEEVFDFVADGRNEPKYNPQMLRSELITTGPVGVGSRFAALHRGLRRPVEMGVELTEYDRPRRLGSSTQMAWAQVDGVLTFEPDGTATRLRWVWHVRPTRRWRLAAPLVKAIGGRQERACWHGLKKYLESNPVRQA